MREFIINHPYISITIASGIGIGLGTLFGYNIGTKVVEFVTECQNCVTNEHLLKASEVCITGIAERNDFRPDTVITILLTDYHEATQQVVQTVITT